MKIRNGFVSNSSSSSFTLTRGVPFNTPLEVAYHMIMERDWPDDQELLKQLRLLARSGEITAETNLCFNSTNYDTYIWTEEPDGDHQPEDRIRIYTCNNIDWQFPKEVRYDDEDSGYEGSHNKKFKMIKTGIEGMRVSDIITEAITRDTGLKSFDTWCKTCGTDGWFVSEGKSQYIVCPKCCSKMFHKSAFGTGNKWEKF